MPKSTKRLVLIGLGLGGPDDMTRRGLREAREAEHLFLESYTSIPAEGSGALERLEREVDARPAPLDRKAVESAAFLNGIPDGETAAFLVWGDPMAATTHVDLVIRARKLGFAVEVVHNASIMSVVPGTLGLSHYKFGRTVTLVKPRERYFPTSPYELLAKNRKMDLHTLALLDIDTENGYAMTAGEGLSVLLESSRRVRARGKARFAGSDVTCVVARAGSSDQTVRCGTADELVKEDFGPPPHSIVVPGKLHFMEAEALVELAGAKRELFADVLK